MDGEAIHIVVDAPAECATIDGLFARVEELGGHARIATDDTRARTFVVTITPDEDHFVARLVVRDLVGRESARSVRTKSCSDAGRSASLLVSLALDEDPPVEPSAQSSEETPFRWPQPMTTETPIAPPPSSKPVGSGGVVVSGMYGWRNGRSGTELYGARTYAAWRFGVTRIGGSLAIEHDSDRSLGTTVSTDRRETTTGRAAAIIGWGAPWNDSVVGFVGELGVSSAWTKTYEPRPWDATLVDMHRRRDTSLYGAAWLVLQVPWRHAIRPVGGFGVMATERGQDLPVAFAADMGVVWQAW